jgi:hypothetical protein
MVAWKELDDSGRIAWASAVAPRVIVDRTSRAILVSGPCTACGHAFSLVLTGEDILEEATVQRGPSSPDGLSAELDWSGAIRFLAACYCAEDHEGRPAVIDHGCGATGWLIDEPEV